MFLFFSDNFSIYFFTYYGLGLVSVIYGLPIYKNGSIYFAGICRLKNIFNRFVWSYVWGLPALINDEPLYYLALFERFLFIFAITIPFDVRDVNYDASDLATIPQYFGINTARWMALLAIFSSELILFVFFFNNDLNLMAYCNIYSL